MALALQKPALKQQFEDFGKKVKTLGSKSSLGPIGFELGKNSVRAVQIQHGSTRPRLRTAASQAYPLPKEELMLNTSAFRSFVRAFLKKHQFHGNKIVTCTPSDELRTLTIDYPISDVANEEQEIVEQVRRRVDQDLSELVIDYLPARSGAGADKRTALVAVASANKQVEFLELHRKAGLEVVGLEIGPIAIRRLVENIARVKRTPNVMVVNCGVERSYLTVTSGRRLMLDRSVQFGEKQVVEKLASALDMSYEEVSSLLLKYGVDQNRNSVELLGGLIESSEIVSTILEVVTPAFYEVVRDIERVASYVHAQLHGADITHIFLLGSVARWPGADVYLQGLLNRPVSTLNPFECFFSDPDSEKVLNHVPVAAMAVATGCALSELR